MGKAYLSTTSTEKETSLADDFQCEKCIHHGHAFNDKACQKCDGTSSFQPINTTSN